MATGKTSVTVSEDNEESFFQLISSSSSLFSSHFKYELSVDFSLMPHLFPVSYSHTHIYILHTTTPTLHNPKITFIPQAVCVFYMKMDSTLIPQIKHGIMDEDEDSLGSFTSYSSSSSSSELTEDTASSEFSSSSASSSPENPCKGPLFELSSLKEQLPFKRGLSKFYEGKSQSFTSMSAVRRLEDLVKPERPVKRLKMSRSCGGGLDRQRTSSPALRCCSNKRRTIMKKPSSSSISGGRRNCFLLLGSKPPLYPQRPSNLSDQALWFA